MKNKTLIEHLNNELPLKIDEVSWDNTTLLIRGVNWWFRIETEWRLIDGQKIFGCEDDSIVDRLSRIHTFERVVRQSHFVDDPALIFNDNIIIEVFSTEMKPEMWIVITPSHNIYESFGNV